ncbi:cbb3-type cytochrome oxidase assembly protein CcoS [Pseudomonas sp. NW5]|uniref:cbb3-type cytochrome oxidase assembly protein CcoS n=1 Tax=Pseudomonas sp. NW5 TaxID=2934934 RepID=UPI0020207390|nr:cbb3-type cytochrome oxidase assembly protein CcoS [Pseudomonas sp. NW5]MCL7462575.1 cbb3-type cytochrome oxidase assembly protein CcoS [Pseudomonas sp. NW5]
MSALYLLIPVAVVVVGLVILLFFWAVNNGQYDDLDSPAHSILFDEDDPKHTEGIRQADAVSAAEAPKTAADHPSQHAKRHD